MLKLKTAHVPVLLMSSMFLLQGCGGERAAPTGIVTGTVTYEGKPVKSLVVELFSPELGVGSTGISKEDGTFRIDGNLQVGKYAATVRPRPPYPGQPVEKIPPIPKKYSAAKTSGFEVTVAAGENVLEIPLTK
ncbi:carboxypeptidase-like regulatory domain-containing protein [Planctomicrobium sp. SH661]|uniref:carboxypeptidase-like regulatory domain-containing protein n=1 Tax=Planctomicrobium sp. SH661 TaxID=3448124 RepID=UPI003F5B012C